MEVRDRTEKHAGVSSNGNRRAHALSGSGLEIVIPDLKCGAGHTWSCRVKPGTKIPKYCPEHYDAKAYLVYKEMVCPYDNHVWHVWARPKGTRTKYCPRHVRERKVECAAGHIWIWKFDADKVGRSPPKWCPEHLKEGRLASIRAANARPRARSPFLTGDELRKEIHRQLFETLLTLPTSEAFQAGTPESRMLEGIRMKCVDYECKHDHLPSDNNITCNCWSHEWIAWARRYAL